MHPLHGVQRRAQTAQGSYLVQKVTIEDDRNVPKKERITASELDRYVWQSPNKRFLGTNFYVWVYNQSNPDKDNWWNRFKRKIGEKPVVYDPALTLKSAENLKAYMESHGFFSSRVRYHVDTTSRRKRAIITYRTEQGPPSRYGKINYEFNDKFIEKIILQDTASTLIRPGGIFNSATLDAERERITRYLRDRGYYNFSVNNISYRYPYDTVGSRVGDLTMVVKQYLTGYNDRGEPVMENNKVYRISEINMLPGYDPTVSFTDREVRYDTVAYRGLNVVYDGKHNVRPCAAPGDSALSQLPLQRGADQPHLQQHHVAGLLQEHAHHLRRTAGARQHEPRLLHRQRRRLAGHAIYAGRCICVATFSARRSSNRVTRSTWKGRPLRVSTD